jgi:DnaJ-class molecular chaperone
MDGVPQTVNKADYRTLAKRLHLAARAPKRRSIPAGRVECPECGGAGTVQGFPKDQTCPTCNGRGSVKPKRRTKRG